MKANYRRLAALALFVLALSAAALAQDFGPRVRAQIPFSFYAGSKALPAGSYTFAINRQSLNVTIYQNEKGVATFLLGSPHDGSKNGLALLTFRTNDEGPYVLQQLQGPDYGLSFSSGKALSRLVEERPAGATQVVIAELLK
jgi:hypothetical protein